MMSESPHATSDPALANNINPITSQTDKAVHRRPDYLPDSFHGNREGKADSGRRILRFPGQPVIDQQSAQGQMPPTLDISLDRRQVELLMQRKPMVAPMRVVDNLQHRNNLKDELNQNGVGNKTTNELLDYIRGVDAAMQNLQLPGVLQSLQDDPLYLVYQELNLGIDTSSSMAFARRFLTGQSISHPFERPLLQTTIDLCKCHPGITLARLVEKLAAGHAQSQSEAVRTWLQFLDNRITPEGAEGPEHGEMGRAGANNPVLNHNAVDTGENREGAAVGGRRGWKRSIVKAGFTVLLLLSRLGAAAGSTTPLGARGGAFDDTASGLYLSPSPVPGGATLPPAGSTTETGADFRSVNY
nr:hypothetical protein [Endozoicomonas sp.]